MFLSVVTALIAFPTRRVETKIFLFAWKFGEAARMLAFIHHTRQASCRNVSLHLDRSLSMGLGYFYERHPPRYYRSNVSIRKRCTGAICDNRKRRRYTASTKRSASSWIMIEGCSPCRRSSACPGWSRSSLTDVAVHLIVSTHSRSNEVSCLTSSIPQRFRNVF